MPQVFFGLLAVALEGNHKRMPEWLKSFLFEWCHLVTMLTGRGIIYMLIGGIITAAQVNQRRAVAAWASPRCPAFNSRRCLALALTTTTPGLAVDQPVRGHLRGLRRLRLGLLRMEGEDEEPRHRA